ncbi:MAG: DUF429 domain-containing protein [Chloroflexota bacterium]
MKFIGLDGCRAGWFFVGFDDHGRWEAGTVSTIADLATAIKASEEALIDIPIGLRESGTEERLCDLAARKLLRKRRASVFPAPCRPAIQCLTYEEASATNHTHTGRKLSWQSWGIVAKIKEVDDFLQDRALKGKLREMHPEIGFWAFNANQEMFHSKKKAEGVQQRLTVLRHYCQQTDDIVAYAMARYKRKDVGKDDILDALIVAIAATFANDLVSLPIVPELDAQGLAMEIVYPALERIDYDNALHQTHQA